jgi:hypothetical protein
VGHKEVPVTHLRKMMPDELQRRNYAQSTVIAYISALREFAGYSKGHRPAAFFAASVMTLTTIC